MAWLLGSVLALLGAAAAEVVELTASNFEEKWKANDLMLVEFYHKNSESHKLLIPELQTAVSTLTEKGVEAVIGRVDVHEHTRLKKKFHIPDEGEHHDRSVLKMFRKGLDDPIPYKKAFISSNIISFIEKASLPPTRTLTSVSEAIDLTESDKSVVIGFFDTRDTIEYEIFVKSCKSFQGTSVGEALVFAEVVDPILIKEFEIVYTPMVFLFKPGEDAVGYTGRYEVANLNEWVETVGVNLVRELRPDNFLELFDQGRPALLLFLDEAEPQAESMIGHVGHAARDFSDSLLFLHTVRSQYSGLADKLGVQQTPGLAIMDFNRREHYLFPGDATNFTADQVTDFAQQYLSGSLAKAPDAPELPAKVPQTLEDIPETVVIANPSKDILMDFWVPWCDFYIHISVPQQGSPRVAIPEKLPQFTSQQPVEKEVVEEPPVNMV